MFLASGAATVFAVIAATLWWKKKALRFVSVLLFMVGVCGAAAIVGFLGSGINRMSLGGVSIFALLAIFGGICFWFEVVKKDKPHKIRTPIISWVFGVSLMTASGAIFGAFQDMARQSVERVDQIVVENVGGQAPTGEE
jgi:uncharacterized membrane protein YfcA